MELAYKQYVDGVHFNVRLEDDRLACLVIIGVRPDGVKEVIAIDDGYRESTESWLTLLRAPDYQAALEEIERFTRAFADKYPKVVATLTKDQEQMLTFFNYPAVHWIHLRTTNAIESTFSTVKARTRATKGAGSRKAGLAMAFKLLMMAEKRWRKLNAPHLVAVVQACVSFPDGQTRILPDMPQSVDSLICKPVEVAV